jgi:hypothetical protein
MDHGRTVNKIFESKPEGRKRGRPRLRWLKDEEENLWEMTVKRWRQQAVYREEWASVIKQAKALRGPYSQGITNSPCNYTMLYIYIFFTYLHRLFY